MNRDAKKINSSSRPDIEKVKSYIRMDDGRGFDGDGYVFKTAVREMKKELEPQGQTIKLNRTDWMYHIVDLPPVQLNLVS